MLSHAKVFCFFSWLDSISHIAYHNSLILPLMGSWSRELGVLFSPLDYCEFYSLERKKRSGLSAFWSLDSSWLLWILQTWKKGKIWFIGILKSGFKVYLSKQRHEQDQVRMTTEQFRVHRNTNTLRQGLRVSETNFYRCSLIRIGGSLGNSYNKQVGYWFGLDTLEMIALR